MKKKEPKNTEALITTELEKKIASLEEANETLKTQVEKANDAEMRALADLQNFQRRESENKMYWSRDAVIRFNEGLLPRFGELLQCAAHTNDTDAQKTIQTFFEALNKNGLTTVNPKEGTPIDTDFHEVVLTAPGKKDTVVSVLEMGWIFQDKVIKPAKVSAGQ